MIRRIMILMTCYIALSLPAHADRNALVLFHEYIAHDKLTLSDSLAIVHFITQISGDEKLIAQIDVMNLVPSSDRAQRYSYFCTIVDWSLKDFKKINSAYNRAKIQEFLYELVGSQGVTISQLLSMQRDNRHLVKDMIVTVGSMADSDYLELSLQQLFHALHEVKKEISTLDKTASIRAWYIYVMLFFLHQVLMQGKLNLESTKHQKVDQQVIMHQLFYLSERFKQTILSDFTIAKGVS